MKVHSPEQIIEAIADSKSLKIFCTIANGEGDRDNLQYLQGLTRKQYYSRTARLSWLGLIKRSKGQFSLTALGLVVYHAQLEIGCAVANYWKLKAIDSIQSSGQIGEQERTKLFKTILNNEKMEKILINSEE